MRVSLVLRVIINRSIFDQFLGSKLLLESDVAEILSLFRIVVLNDITVVNLSKLGKEELKPIVGT